jgi:hypothetical protein
MWQIITLNQRVTGSSPVAPTNKTNHLAALFDLVELAKLSGVPHGVPFWKAPRLSAGAFCFAPGSNTRAERSDAWGIGACLAVRVQSMRGVRGKPMKIRFAMPAMGIVLSGCAGSPIAVE